MKFSVLVLLASFIGGSAFAAKNNPCAKVVKQYEKLYQEALDMDKATIQVAPDDATAVAEIRKNIETRHAKMLELVFETAIENPECAEE